MNKTSVLLVSFADSEAVQGNIDLHKLMARALSLEKKLSVPNASVDFCLRQYSLYCDRIEFAGGKLAVQADGLKVKTLDLGCGYLDVLFEAIKTTEMGDEASRLLSSFCPANLVSSYLKLFLDWIGRAGIGGQETIRKKIAFYTEAAEAGWSVIELQQPWSQQVGSDNVQIDGEDLRNKFLSLRVSDEISEENKGGHFIALRKQITKAVEQVRAGGQAAINFSGLRHDVITEILHEFAYGREKIVWVDVVYGDGSKARPIPLFSLGARDGLAQNVGGLGALRIGMMSERHSNDGLDLMVSSYWFLNKEISVGGTQAEIDEIAYEKTRRMLAVMRSEGPYEIDFYQTGFQPAVVGFYRALIEAYGEGGTTPTGIVVTPYYFMGGEYRVGKTWR